VTRTTTHERRWYRQLWPWLLILPPLASVVGGILVLWLAVGTSDGLVAEDYYRQGVTINERLARERAVAECPAKDHECAALRAREAP